VPSDSLRITSFQGSYSGSSFVVDGLKGLGSQDAVTRELGPKKLYYLLPAKGPAPLLVVLPGGNGSAKDVLPFWKNAHELAFKRSIHIAVVSAPRFDAEQNVTWVTRFWKDRVQDASFVIEDFACDVVEDARKQVEVDAKKIILHGVSSGGPPVYALLYEKDSPFTGYWILSSVFRPNQLPSPDHTVGRRVYLQHAREDQTTPFRMAQDAYAALEKRGSGEVSLDELPSGHGYPIGQKTPVWVSLRRAVEILTLD